MTHKLQLYSEAFQDVDKICRNVNNISAFGHLVIWSFGRLVILRFSMCKPRSFVFIYYIYYNIYNR